MALIKCPECGNSFSNAAKYCPHCGYPIELITDSEKVKTADLKESTAITENTEIETKMDSHSVEEKKSTINNSVGFISQSFDKFKDTTSTTCNVKLELPIRDFGVNATMDIRHVSSPEADVLVIDLYMSLIDWVFIRNGCIIFNIDGIKNIKLQAHEMQSEVYGDVGIDAKTQVKVYESVYYIITRDEFKDICDARCLSIQINGDKARYNLAGEEIQSYCRLFYNQFYDSTKYPYSVNDYWPKLRRSANRNNVKQKAGDALRLFSVISDGCSGMFLLLVGTGIGVIYAIVSIIQTIVA